MKRLHEMNRDELKSFGIMTIQIVQHVLGNEEVDMLARPALMGMWAKGHNRYTRNVRTEWEIDKEAFAEDVRRHAAWFIDTFRELLLDTPPGVVIAMDAAQAKRMEQLPDKLLTLRTVVFSPDYMPVIRRTIAYVFDPENH